MLRVPALVKVAPVSRKSAPGPLQVAAPWLVNERWLRNKLDVLSVNIDPDGIVIAPVPLSVPPDQAKVPLTESAPVPVRVPPLCVRVGRVKALALRSVVPPLIVRVPGETVPLNVVWP